MKQLLNCLLVVASILLTGVLAEAATRLIDGLPLLTDWLPETLDRDSAAKHLDAIPRAPGVDRAWFFSDPAPLSNRGHAPPEWVRLAQKIGEAPPTVNTAYRPADAFKAWNSAFVGNPCSSRFFRQAPGRLYVYDPPDGLPHPRFRFLPNATTPLGLVTNEIGWRGPPIEDLPAKKAVRIVFVGASTTVNSHYYPYSYPELVGHWLNLWAAAHGLGIEFEALNAGREGVSSTDIEAIVRLEASRLSPDLVVYYEGVNQFDMTTSLREWGTSEPVLLNQIASETSVSRWLRAASHRFALARRLQSALGLIDNPGQGVEWPKPVYELVWPNALDEADPDLSRADLPVNLSVILSDFDRMRTGLESVGAEFAVSSFVWMVHDGMVLDPVRHKVLLEWLNVTHFPFRYADIERMVTFQNRVFRKYAGEHGLGFFDVAGLIPKDPDLFTDAIHMSYAGIRLHAWIVMQGLVPMIEANLAKGVWPRPVRHPVAASTDLLFSPHELKFECQ